MNKSSTIHESTLYTTREFCNMRAGETYSDHCAYEKMLINPGFSLGNCKYCRGLVGRNSLRNFETDLLWCPSGSLNWFTVLPSPTGRVCRHSCWYVFNPVVKSNHYGGTLRIQRNLFAAVKTIFFRLLWYKSV